MVVGHFLLFLGFTVSAIAEGRGPASAAPSGSVDRI